MPVYMCGKVYKDSVGVVLQTSETLLSSTNFEVASMFQREFLDISEMYEISGMNTGGSV